MDNRPPSIGASYRASDTPVPDRVAMPPLRVFLKRCPDHCRSLEQHGIRDCADLLIKTDLSDVSRATNVPFNVLADLRKKIIERYGQKVGSMADRIQTVEPHLRRCPTGCHAVDRFLSGGIGGGQITQITGAEGCGKTQFCYSIATDEILRGNRVMFIDTESTFCAERVTAILRNKAGRSADLTSLMERMLVVQLHHLHELFDLIYKLIEETKANPSHYSLLILDSVPAIVTAYLNELDDDQEQFSVFKELIRSLNILRHTNPSLVILVTNNKLKWFKRMWQNACAMTLLIEKKPVTSSMALPQTQSVKQEQNEDDEGIAASDAAESQAIVRKLEVTHWNGLTVKSDPRFEVVITDAGISDYSPNPLRDESHSMKTEK